MTIATAVAILLLTGCSSKEQQYKLLSFFFTGIPTYEEFISEKEDFEMYPPDSKGNFRRINDLDKYLIEAFEKDKFLSELSIPWAKKR